MTGRELAWRVLANEIHASTAEERGTGAKSPSYLISPLGARMNRVLVAGTVAPTRSAGADTPGGFVSARLTDPTGILSVTAGSYQPQGKADLERLASPISAIVVGKVGRFRSEGTVPVASILAETIQPVTDVELRALTAEAATQTLERLEIALRLRGPTPPSDKELAEIGVAPAWVRGARASVERYSTLDPSPFIESVRAVLVAVRAGPSTSIRALTAPEALAPLSEVTRAVRSRGSEVNSSPPPPVKALEGRLLEILDELADASPDGYADMDDLAERAARHGLEGERMEELLNYLAENGTVEEPLVGKFRRGDGPPRA